MTVLVNSSWFVVTVFGLVQLGLVYIVDDFNTPEYHISQKGTVNNSF